MDASQVPAFLTNNAPLFKDFPPDRLEELARGSRIMTFEPNEAIIAFGEEGRFLGVMLDGTAEVSVTDDSGERHRLATIGEGEIFGEMSLMTGDRTMADVIGITSCTALLVPQDLFSTILVTYPRAVKYLSKMISARAKKSAFGEFDRNLAASALRKSNDPYGLLLKTDQPEKVLVINCRSQSLKYNIFDTHNDASNARGIVEKIGQMGTRHTFQAHGKTIVGDLPRAGHAEAFGSMVSMLTAADTGSIRSLADITAVGHRVVHGGEKFSVATLITDAVVAELEKVAELAPLDNPVNLIGIAEARRVFRDIPHVAVFDTAFHQTLPPYAYLYGLPYDYYEQKHIRRYGFHGMSHFYVSLKAAQFLKRPFNEMEIISCHLGNGASLCAVDHGRSVDTSMGFTPAEGLIMGTRCGQLDPGILIYLMQRFKMSADDLNILINRESGLQGISGVSDDMLEIQKAAEQGNHRALLAFKTYCYQIRKNIGAYVAAMQGLDVVIFTGGIGWGSAGVRSLTCQGLGCIGIHVDEKKNQSVADSVDVCDIAADDARARVLVIRTDEERMIARETIRALAARPIAGLISLQKNAPVPIEISAHHVHLCQAHVEALFGPGHNLTRESDLSQPGQFASQEKVALVGPKGRVERVRVLGPARSATQVEIAMTEQFRLGVHPPIRESGDIENTPGITLEGAHGTVTIEKGVICAMRHIHVSPEDALRYGLRDKYIVRVRVEGARELIFGDVLVRVHPNFKLAMHIDTDEGNAGNIGAGAIGYIDGIQSRN